MCLARITTGSKFDLTLMQGLFEGMHDLNTTMSEAQSVHFRLCKNLGFNLIQPLPPIFTFSYACWFRRTRGLNVLQSRPSRSTVKSTSCKLSFEGITRVSPWWCHGKSTAWNGRTHREKNQNGSLLDLNLSCAPAFP